MFNLRKLNSKMTKLLSIEIKQTNPIQRQLSTTKWLICLLMKNEFLEAIFIKGFNMSYDKIQWVHQALILRFCFLRLAADFIAFANLAQQALENNIKYKSMLEHLKSDIAVYKLGSKGNVYKNFYDDCQHGQTNSRVFQDISSNNSFRFIATFNLTYDTKTNKSICPLY